ncbi:hypothetical protein BDN71DRAFT_169308 [Pleurotus eryngii]|uniref:Uncharacterized protein n=1 Tax=Pleurotus eryngii TaxID=5323 RepID=A0A9P6A8Y6_PLEER|nr:hypothetical protein BDN71DRAFT_169308 [Pleurotus eryngii]
MSLLPHCQVSGESHTLKWIINHSGYHRGVSIWRSVFYPFREELRTSPTHLSVPIYQNFPTVGYKQLMPRANAYIYPWFITAYQLFVIAFLVSPSDYLQVRR